MAILCESQNPPLVLPSSEIARALRHVPRRRLGHHPEQRAHLRIARQKPLRRRQQERAPLCTAARELGASLSAGAESNTTLNR